MHAHDGRAGRGGAAWTGDFWGGLTAMLVALPSSVAFGALVYAALGPERVGEGAMAGVLGAAALGIAAPLCSRTAGLISAPCAPAAAVLSALTVELLGRGGEHGVDPSQVPVLLALTALLAALLQVVYGVLGGGRLIKFIPYPVVSGYLSGVGVLIALGQLPKLLGLPPGTPLLAGITSPDLWRWEGLIVGLVTVTVTLTSGRVTQKIPAAILGLLGGILVYGALALFDPALRTAVGNPMVIGPIQASGSFIQAAAGRARALLQLDAASLGRVAIPALTLSVLLSIDTLKTCVVLDVLTRTRHNSNRELIGQGIGNAASFLAGGMPGAGTMGPTLVNVTSGGQTYRSGVVAGACVVATLLFLKDLIAWLPIGALAGILLVIAWRMLDKSMLRLLRYRSGQLDFAVIAAVVIVAVTVDLIAAAGVGVFLAILMFIRDQMRGSVIRRKCYLSQVHSKTRRLAREQGILEGSGSQGVFCELQGNLFFGTTDQLFSQLEADLQTAKYVLFDMRRVQSLDFTAAHLLEQVHTRLAERGGRLIFSGMPSAVMDRRDFEHDLVRVGAVREEGGVMISETLDGALEWIEERILESTGEQKTRAEDMLEVRDIELFQGFEEWVLERLAGCLEARSVPAGHRVFSRGEEGDEIFFIRRGTVQALLPLEGGRRHHLATFGQGDFFGEIAFLDRGLRSADADAKTASDLYALSRKSFDTKIRATEPEVSAEVFARLALAIAYRLRQADIELRVLEER